jgi:hypothetical protein
MSTPTVTEYDAATGITISREMTSEEIAEYEATIADTSTIAYPQ